jgi:hypothetical protein
VLAGSVTDRFSLPSSQTYEPATSAMMRITTVHRTSVMRRPRRPG